MPSNYAHYRFGQDVLALLPEEIKKDILAYKALFDIGLHGPDILFYYRPFFSNKVSRKGFDMHDEPGLCFFKEIGENILYKKYRAPYLVYVYGFICHFVLDSQCHGYIDQKIKQSGISHAEIEVEFDRALMLEDGHNPLTHSLTSHIYPSEYHGGIIATFFEGITRYEVVTALKSMKTYNQLLLAPHKAKRWLLYGALKLVGKYKQMRGLIVNDEKNPGCHDSNETLSTLYEKGIEIAVGLISDYETCLQGDKKFSSRYEKTFGVDSLEKEQEVRRIEITN
jgi:hypothetical protein